MEDRSTVDGDDWAVNGTALVPTATLSSPHCTFKILLRVLVVLLVDVVVDLKAANILCLKLFHPFVDVGSGGLDSENQ
jgi:hypothetical protein